MTYQHYYFIGIGGIGMSALARYFHAKGCDVAGYDRTKTPLTEQLAQEGIVIHYYDDVKAIPFLFLDKTTTLVVFTPAIPAEHSEKCFFEQHGFTLMKRAAVLGEITRSQKGVCIAGTHGKTTTSTMTAHLLHQSGIDCSAFLGGISKNYDSNLMLSPDSDYVVIEADEFDRSFHHLSPYLAAITAADPDHLDIYGTPAAFRESFEHFTSLIQPNGALVMKKGLPLTPRLQSSARLYTYAVEEEADFFADNIRIDNGEIWFDFHAPGEVIPDILLGVPVPINIENGTAAMSLAWLAGAKAEELRAGMASYAGIRRRFDILFKNEKVVFIDDYAHHPTELNASIRSLKKVYKGRTVCGIFQPHLYTRTRDFADEFAKALSQLDEVILLDIYPARELPIEGVSSQVIFDQITAPHKTLCSKEELLPLLEKKDSFDVLATFGAGNIDQLLPGIQQMLQRRYKHVEC
ncbi:UDP-N-acetylmuramate--L-alanine ligase [Microbacter margulisiae]|uniref:UDP-N-acetylmuramate--L-alanine ligase n=1 Tax=Microbacter margulisiae TaxID=1350067 RepID=A0A7W5H1K1_9PORP|nr:UDP-N-acetylmuramate--L-alanine ligase [Microbacter margulisiae]MBB3187683.1 UDP-N-acetylmuramate--alanine ligase [Microbacter margulisiae]